jgi:hypothetical protein
MPRRKTKNKGNKEMQEHVHHKAAATTSKPSQSFYYKLLNFEEESSIKRQLKQI